MVLHTTKNPYGRIVLPPGTYTQAEIVSFIMEYGDSVMIRDVMDLIAKGSATATFPDGSTVTITAQEGLQNLINANREQATLEAWEPSFWQQAGMVVGQAFDQAIKGDYAEETTPVGTLAQIGVGFIPVADTITDIRDFTYSAQQFWYKPSWGNAGWVAVDLIGFIPVLGSLKPVFKHGDEFIDATGTVIKNVDNLVDASGNAISKADDVIDVVTDLGKRADEVSDIAKQGDNLTDSVEAIIKHGDDVDTLSGTWKKVDEYMSDSARRYQTYVTGREGEVWVQNGVRFDGMRDGVLLEAKDHYSQFIDVNTGEFYDWFGGQSSLLDEASRQIAASEGALIEWHFSEERTLHAFEQLFSSQNIEGISLVFDPIK